MLILRGFLDLDVCGDFGGLVIGAYPILRSPGFSEVSEIVGGEIKWAACGEWHDFVIAN